MFRRYEDAKEAQDEEQLRSIEASLIQAMNFSSLLFLMGTLHILYAILHLKAIQRSNHLLSCKKSATSS